MTGGATWFFSSYGGILELRRGRRDGRELGAGPDVEQLAAEHPFCEMCYREGRMTLMDEVHHIVPISRGGTHAKENLMSLCQSCHTRIHHEIGDRK